MATNRSPRWLTVLRFAPIISQLLVDILDDVRGTSKDHTSEIPPPIEVANETIGDKINSVLSRPESSSQEYRPLKDHIMWPK
jgi:hypothetical protein